MSEAPARKSILFVGPLPPPITGQSLACQVFLEALQHKYNVVPIDINKSDFASGKFGWGRIFEILRILYQVRRELSNVDLVYFTITESVLGNFKDLLIYLVCWRLLPRTVIHLHGGAGMLRIMRGPTGLLRRANAFFLTRLHSVVVLGNRLRCVYEGVLPPDKVRVVPNFAESAYQASQEAIDAKFQNPSPLRVLYLSNMIYEKGYSLLYEAVKAIETDRPGSILLSYAGGFGTDQERRAFVRSIASNPFVSYHGVVKGHAKRELLEEAHVLALPTWYPYEGQPICILEGYAAGCAVLTTDHSGIFDVFTPGKNGWVVEKRSSESIRNALMICVHNQEEMAAAGRLNAQLARKEYTTSRYNADLLRIIDEALRSS